MRKPIVIAHRGASGYAPENTLASFNKAISLGAEGIELDVHMSKDGYLIVCHDEKVNRTTDGKGYIRDLTLSEIKKLDAGSWFGKEYKNERLPTLNEVLDLIKTLDIMINIEIKNGPIFYPGIEKALLDEIKKYKIEDKVIVSSFNHYSLVEIKKIDSNIKTGVLYMAGMVDPWKYALSLGADAIHPLFYNIVPEVVRGCYENNIMINPFTVNDSEHIETITRLGVSGIITNYPDRAIDIIKNI